MSTDSFSTGAGFTRGMKRTVIISRITMTPKNTTGIQMTMVSSNSCQV